MGRQCSIVSACVLFLVCGGLARADSTTVYFLSLPDVPFATYTEAGVTFNAVGGGLLQKVTPDGNPALTGALDPDTGKFPKLRAFIDAGATSVSVDLGKATWNNEPIFLNIYDSLGAVLGYSDATLPASGTGTMSLSVDAPPGECITYAIFGAKDPTYGSSVYADNFTFTSCPSCPDVIPAPGAVLLGLIGAGLVGRLRQRRTL